jgi:hypothetical protein
MCHLDRIFVAKKGSLRASPCRLLHEEVVKSFASGAVTLVVLPKHLYEGTDILNNPYNNAPVSTGALVFKEWKRGEYPMKPLYYFPSTV